MKFIYEKNPSTNSSVVLKQFSQDVFRRSLYPCLFIIFLSILYWIGTHWIANYYSPSFFAAINIVVNKIWQIVITCCVYWILLIATDIFSKYLHIYLMNKGYQVTSLTISFIMNSLKIILLLSFLNLIVSMLPIPVELSYLTEKLVSTLIIAAITWIFVKLINLIEQMIFMRYKITDGEDLFAHKVHTQITLLKRVILSVIFVLSIGAILMQFSNVKELGASILASAGIATVIVGLTIQKFLTVLIMGLQIALNQPIKINDYVVIENEFGQIEEITLYYVVLKVWDMRKIIIPINYILEKPFQNFSRGSKNLLGTVFFYMDFSLPISKIRNELVKIVNQSTYSDKEVCFLQVSDCKDLTIELRALVSAKNPGNLWNLRCEVREKLLKYIWDHYPQCLPRSRTEPITFNQARKDLRYYGIANE